MIPFEVQDLAKPRARENQQPERSGSVGSDLRAPVTFLGRVLCLGLREVHRVRQPDRFGLPNCFADLGQLRRRQVSFAAFFREVFDPAARIKLSVVR